MVEFKILSLNEKNERLIVEIERNNEIINYSFPLSYKDINQETNKPYYLHKLKKYFERQSIIENKIITNNDHNKVYNTDDIEDLSNKAIRKARSEKQKFQSHIIPDKLLKDEYKEIMQRLKEKHDKLRLERDKKRYEEFLLNKSKNTRIASCSISKQQNQNLTK